jgi:hypothetical protein
MITPSDDLVPQVENPLAETPFEALQPQEERLVAGVEEAMEEAMEEIPTTPTAEEENTLEAMASSAARNPPSSRAIERTLSLSYLSGRSTRC